MGGNLRRHAQVGLCTLLLGCMAPCLSAARAVAATVPATQVKALDDHTVNLPQDLGNDRATVLILGFGQKSKDATTAWEKPVRMQLAHPGQVGFYDMAMLAEVPGFVRPLVLRSIKHAVPDVLKPNFLPLSADEASWKQVAGYDSAKPDAAYVMVVDSHGTVRWSTSQPFSDVGWHALNDAVRSLTGNHP